MKDTIVLGVIGSDCHSVGNKVLEYYFQKAGFNVINIGMLNSQEDFIDAAKKNGASGIIVSTINGHGELECQGFRDKCTKYGIDEIVLYVGGNLTVGIQDWETIERKYKKMGFNRVFSPNCSLDEAIRQLKMDLRHKEVGKNII